MNRCVSWMALLALAIVTGLLFAPVCNFGFVNYDDPFFVTDNPHVQSGLTSDSLAWAWTSCNGFWHPITWMSFQLDRELFGPGAGGFHRTSWILHIINVLLVLGVLYLLTGGWWRSVLGAAIFALHPVQVEAVAWVSERKGVLSATFGLLTILAYLRYVRQPGLVRYLLTLVAGALSLLAKPMLVTLPFLLLLLDVWPLRRFTRDWRVLRRVIFEKLPLLITALLVSWIAVIAEDSHGALAADIREPLGVRLLNIPVVYLHYLGMAAWPVNLVPFYPYFPGQWSSGQQCVALVGLAGIVGMLLFLSRRQPGLLVGLLWFAGTLFPVVGLVPVGSHLLADRYLYFPIIGLILMLAALIDRIAHQEVRTRWLIVPPALLVLLACGITTHRQLHHWQDSGRLWAHTLRVSRGNWVGHNNYAIWLREQGQDEAALRHLRESARINPAQPRTYLNLGVTCDRLGRSAEAEGYFLTVLQFDPDQPDALTAMGAIRKQQGRLTEARELLARAIEKAPGKVCAHDHLGDVLWREGRRREALAAYQAVLKLQADAIEPMNKAGLVLLELGRPAEALDLFTRAIQHESKQAVLQANAGAACFNLGRLEDAVQWFREALKLDPWYASAHLKLAQTLIRLGRLSEAADHQSRAIALNPDFAGVLPPAGSLPSQMLRPERGSPRTVESGLQPGSPPATPPVGNPQPAWVGPR